LIPKGIAEMKRLSIDPQIKSAFSGYHEQVIRIMSEQDKSSQLRSIAKITTVNLISVVDRFLADSPFLASNFQTDTPSSLM